MSIPGTVQDIEAGTLPETVLGNPQLKVLPANPTKADLIAEVEDILAELQTIKNGAPRHDEPEGTS